METAPFVHRLPSEVQHWLFTQTVAMAMMLHTDRAIRPGAEQDAPSWVYL